MIPTGSYVTAVTSREVRDLADLGSASRALGERWELIGGEHIAGLIGQELRAPSGEAYRCRAALRLDRDGQLLSESAGLGLKSPDCLFAGHDRLGRLVLQPGDFKFTLDIATREQIDPAPIRALLAGGGPRLMVGLATLLAEAGVPPTDAPGPWLLAELDGGRARLLPGFFLSPDEPANRLFLRQSPRRRGSGLTESDVRLLPIEARRFFAGLPGNLAAPLLRVVDGATTNDFATATYYYQLGAAVEGALRLLQRPLLPLLGPEPESPTLEQVQRQIDCRGGRWAVDIARDLAAPAIQRRERLRLAGRLAGLSLRGRLTYETLEAAGWQVGDEVGPGTLDKPTIKLLLDQVEVSHNAALAIRLEQRRAAGPLADDQTVLDWLREIRPQLEEHDRDELLRRLPVAGGA